MIVLILSNSDSDNDSVTDDDSVSHNDNGYNDNVSHNDNDNIRESDTALVLTSHSMEECDALCTQIAIMTNGEFRCLGSTQHIKSKYGSGYSLAIRLYTTNQIESAKELITKMFPNARLMDEHILHLNYELMIEKGQKWSMLFEKVGKLAELIDAADYSISQTTLDQIFLDFSRNARTDIVKSHF
ncbi:unnamed protein product [Brugia pahangi]|uniref:ABC transporter domain-containing protein n=1 Tax=Brugia pahangi TaxID=6280 RepID=A0A0N4TR09_BRUPA|nr:unnamed protein product [Brugia pahangi]